MQQFFDTTEVTGDFQVIGAKEQDVTGPVTGLQDVKSIYELVLHHWTATPAYHLQRLIVQNADAVTVDSAVLNIG